MGRLFRVTPRSATHAAQQEDAETVVDRRRAHEGRDDDRAAAVANSIGTVTAVVPVSSTTSTIAVTGARTTAANRADIPQIAIAIRASPGSPGSEPRRDIAHREPRERAEREQGREHDRRGPRGVGQRPGHESRSQVEQHEGKSEVMTGQDQLREHVSPAHDGRIGEERQAHQGTDDRGAGRSRDDRRVPWKNCSIATTSPL